MHVQSHFHLQLQSKWFLLILATSYDDHLFTTPCRSPKWSCVAHARRMWIWAYVCMPSEEECVLKKNNIAFKTPLLSSRTPRLCRSDKIRWPVAIFTCLQSHKLSCWVTKDEDTFYTFSPPLFPIFNNTTCSQHQHICHPPALQLSFLLLFSSCSSAPPHPPPPSTHFYLIAALNSFSSVTCAEAHGGTQ